MLVDILKSKILRAEVTQAEVDYEGSLAIDSELMERIGLLPYEKILVGNITNGERLETYAIAAPAGSREFALNGAAAHRGKPGDLLVIMSFARMTPEEAAKWSPRVVVLADSNRTIIKERLPDETAAEFRVV
ncbi:aspartate 1-decarboxylase [Cerasicoccus arenae]|uniref:Aspartate 1-decarboxylase n=1 Tax=Cerasicoccus arenae TaxID=424488 RepID=A0A8J3DCH8_9BACT|nr:aspartate 1-decarboxylase [Cerasicoccus arenae]MBK1858813.1 aspartate 1-decarboxylase [Cerasicoccus arenae]GHC04449.1 aspartate 1-decarboxylase [Cerasicoccus arenae]